MRSYEAARTYFSIMGFGAWSVIIIGVLVALVSAGGVSQYAGGGAGLLAMLPGFGIVIVGFLLLVFVQIGRANVDTAEYTQQMLKISRDQLDVSKQSLKQGDTFQKNYASLNMETQDASGDERYSSTMAEPEKVEKPKPIKQIEQKTTYKGYSILAKDEKFRVNENVFATIEFAKEHIDQHVIRAEGTETKTSPVQVEQESNPNQYKGKNIEVKGDKYVCSGIPFKSMDAAKNYIDNFLT